MSKKHENCMRKRLVSLSDLCGKQRRIPISNAKRFKANWGLSDASLLVKYSRLGFRFNAAVRHVIKNLLLSRYAAAGPITTDLLLSRYLAAGRAATSDARYLLSIKSLSVALSSGLFNDLGSPLKNGFQQSAVVKVTSAPCQNKQDFSFTPSEPIPVNTLQRIEITGPVEDRNVTTSFNLATEEVE